jgi:hypothetical protein
MAARLPVTWSVPQRYQDGKEGEAAMAKKTLRKPKRLEPRKTTVQKVRESAT